MENKARKRRVDAMECTFKFYNCATLTIYFSDRQKIYMFEPVIMKKAKAIAKYEQPVFSLYRDLHKTKAWTTLYGIRAIDIDGFNAEGHCCKIEVHQGAGKDTLLA